MVATLISTYNGERFLKTQIDSVFSQKCDATLQVIARDDGSVDKTQEAGICHSQIVLNF